MRNVWLFGWYGVCCHRGSMSSLWMEHAVRLAEEGHEQLPPMRTPVAPGKQTRTAGFPPRGTAEEQDRALAEIAALLRGLGLGAGADLPTVPAGAISDVGVADDPFALHLPRATTGASPIGLGRVTPEAPAEMLARAAATDGATHGGAIADAMNLDDVPVHRGEATRAALAELGVRGASAGDRVFAADDDPHVLAHELAHVAQGAGADAPGAEREADEVADAVLGGSLRPPAPRGTTARGSSAARGASVPAAWMARGRRAPAAAAMAFYGGTVNGDRVNLRSRADRSEARPPQLARGTTVDIERTQGGYYYVRVLDGEHAGAHGYIATTMVTVTPQAAAQPGNTPGAQPGNPPGVQPGNPPGAQPAAAVVPPDAAAAIGRLLAADLSDASARALGIYLDAHPAAAPIAARLVVEHLLARAGRPQLTQQIRARLRRVTATRPAFQSAIETEVQGRVHSRAVEARELTEGTATGTAPGGLPGQVSIWHHYRRAVLSWAVWRVATDRVTADERQRQPPAEEGPMRRWALSADSEYRLERARWEALRARRDRDLREIEAVSSLDDDAAEEHVELADHLTETNAREINRSATQRNHLNRLGPRIAADDRGEPAEGVAAEQELDDLRRDLGAARDDRDHLPPGDPAHRRHAQNRVRTAQRRLDTRTRQTQGPRRQLERYRAEHQRLIDEHARAELATLTADREAGMNEIIAALSWDGADATVWTPALRARVWDQYLQHVPSGVNDGPAHQLVMETNIISVVADRQNVGGGRADMGFGTHHSVSTYSRHGSGQFDVNTDMNQRIWAVLPAEADFATVLDTGPPGSTTRTSFVLRRVPGLSRVHHVISLAGSDAADADMMAKLLDGLMGRGHGMGDLRAWGGGAEPLAGVTARDVIGALYYENTQAQDNSAPGGGRRSTTSAVAERDAARAELERVTLARLHALTPPAIPAGPGVPTPPPVISYAAIAGPLFVAQDLGASNAAHQDDVDRGHLTGDAGPGFRAGISPQAAVRDAAFDAALTPALAGFTGTAAQRTALVRRLRGAYRADVMRAAGGALNAHDPGLEGALRNLVRTLDHNAPASRVHADRAGQMVTVTHRFHDAVTSRDFTVAVDYIHMSSVFVRAGTAIPEGAPFLIGRTGSSGNALTPHVHMGIAVYEGTTPAGPAREMPHLDPVSFFRTTPAPPTP